MDAVMATIRFMLENWSWADLIIMGATGIVFGGSIGVLILSSVGSILEWMLERRRKKYLGKLRKSDAGKAMELMGGDTLFFLDE